jgi:hypothetical protein
VRNEINPDLRRRDRAEWQRHAEQPLHGHRNRNHRQHHEIWRLTWNIAKTEVDLSDRYPLLHAFRDTAKARNRPTPETDLFLASVPEGVPLPGYTKWRSNLVTRYRFIEGPLKNFSIGLGAQYRDKSYRGNLDVNRDGVAEQHWSPGYTLYTLMAGYRTKVMQAQRRFRPERLQSLR